MNTQKVTTHNRCIVETKKNKSRNTRLEPLCLWFSSQFFVQTRRKCCTAVDFHQRRAVCMHSLYLLQRNVRVQVHTHTHARAFSWCYCFCYFFCGAFSMFQHFLQHNHLDDYDVVVAPLFLSHHFPRYVCVSACVRACTCGILHSPFQEIEKYLVALVQSVFFVQTPHKWILFWRPLLNAFRHKRVTSNCTGIISNGFGSIINEFFDCC